LAPEEWGPCLNDYGYYCQRSGDLKTAQAVFEVVVKYLPDRVVALLNLADAEYALKHIGKARTLYQKYLALAKAQDITNISQTAVERAR
jgi:tetratricopeptide (TPR) repeat protein